MSVMSRPIGTISDISDFLLVPKSKNQRNAISLISLISLIPPSAEWLRTSLKGLRSGPTGTPRMTRHTLFDMADFSGRGGLA